MTDSIAEYPPLDMAKLYEFIEICRVTWPDNPPDVTITWWRPYGGYKIGVQFNGEQVPIDFDADELDDAYDMIERIKEHLRFWTGWTVSMESGRYR